MSFWASAIAVVAAGVWAFREPLLRLHHPYEAIPIQAVDDACNARLLGAVMASKGKYAHIAGPAPHSYKALNGSRTVRLFQGKVVGAESVAVSPSGRLTMLDRYGYVHHATPTNNGEYAWQGDDHPLYLGPGRPLGYHYIGPETLVVCDSNKGLLRVDLQNRSIHILSNAANGKPVDYVNDLDVSEDGKQVYFSSSTRGVVAYSPLGFYDTMRSYLLNLYSADVSGRLLRHDLVKGTTEVLLEGLWYANGVALSPGEDFVAVVETNGFRVMRHWLKGPKSGQTDVLIDNLPGFPDGVARTSDGNFWVCLVIPLSPIVPFLKYIWFRWLMAHLSLTLDATKYFVKNWGCVLKVSPAGQILDVLLDPAGDQVSSVSAVTEHGGKLFIGNLQGDFVSVYTL